MGKCTIDEIKIRKYCKKNNFGYRIHNNRVIITTNTDEWKVEVEDNKLLVFHKNKAGNYSRKHQYHFQRVAYDWDYVFSNIICPHEDYSNVFNKAFRIDAILKELYG